MAVVVERVTETPIINVEVSCAYAPHSDRLVMTETADNRAMIRCFEQNTHRAVMMTATDLHDFGAACIAFAKQLREKE